MTPTPALTMRNVTTRSMIGTTVRLHDITDAEGFVAKQIIKSRVRTSSQEFDELKAEGLLILCDLARRFEPHRPGYPHPGRFSGYAARFLPGRLQDAWKKMHPEHRHTDGTWEYGQPPLSLDVGAGPFEGDGDAGHEADDRFTPRATAYCPGHPEGRFDTVNRAITTLPTGARAPAARFLQLTSDGHGVDTIASTMGVRRGDIQRLRNDVRAALQIVLAEAA